MLLLLLLLLLLVLDRTSRGPGFNSWTGPDFFTISIQCVFVSQCFILNLNVNKIIIIIIIICLIQIASLMGFTWIFGYIAAFTDVEALWYIYIILNSLQGVFIFISFICNRQVGLLWSKKLKLFGLTEILTQNTSTSSTTSRHKTSQVPGTNNTELRYSEGQSGSDCKESTKPLQREVHV